MAVGAFDGIVRVASFTDAHRPDVVVRLGETPASKVLAQWLVALRRDAGAGRRLDAHVRPGPRSSRCALSAPIDGAVPRPGSACRAGAGGVARRMDRRPSGPPSAASAGLAEAEPLSEPAVARALTSGGLACRGPPRRRLVDAGARRRVVRRRRRGDHGPRQPRGQRHRRRRVHGDRRGGRQRRADGRAARRHRPVPRRQCAHRARGAPARSGDRRRRQRRRRDLLLPRPARPARRRPLRAAVRHAARHRRGGAGTGPRPRRHAR